MIDFFLRRPVFAMVCAIVILLLGLVSIPTLPIAQFPNVAPPTVTVQANYTGASAEAVEASVTTPIEQAINGVQGLRYISSQSTNQGGSTDHRDVQSRSRSRSGRQRRAERGEPRARPFAERSQAHRRRRFEEQRHVRDGHRRHDDQSGAVQRSDQQLSRKQRHQRFAAHSRRQRRPGLRRTQIRDAAVGRSEAPSRQRSDRRQRRDGARRARTCKSPPVRSARRRPTAISPTNTPCVPTAVCTMPPASATSCCARRPTAASCASTTSAASNSAPKITRASILVQRPRTPSVSASCSCRPATRCKSPIRSSQTMNRLQQKFPAGMRYDVAFDTTLFVQRIDQGSRHDARSSRSCSSCS